MTNHSRRHRSFSRAMIVIALAALIAAVVGSFWEFDNSADIGCGSVLVSTTEAADRDEMLIEKALREIPRSTDGVGDTYQNDLTSQEEFQNSPGAVLVGTSNVGLCEHARSTVRTSLYGGTAAAIVLASLGWVWMRRRHPPTTERHDS